MSFEAMHLPPLGQGLRDQLQPHSAAAKALDVVPIKSVFHQYCLGKTASTAAKALDVAQLSVLLPIKLDASLSADVAFDVVPNSPAKAFDVDQLTLYYHQ